MSGAMMVRQEGGCLCGSVRYETLAAPARVTICHCRFCQRATGSAYMIEPIFRLEDLRVTKGTLSVYELRSQGSGRLVRVHFCPTCGTKLYLSFERFPEVCGVYAGTFDEPSWFDIGPDTAKHIFTDEARPDTLLPSGISTFGQHAITNDGSPLSAVVFEAPRTVGHQTGQAPADPSEPLA
jgi:hypothetical protein